MSKTLTKTIISLFLFTNISGCSVIAFRAAKEAISTESSEYQSTESFKAQNQ